MIENNDVLSDDDNGNDELDSYFVQALPVADLKDQNLAEPPRTGEEYLSRVRLEASKCPNVVVAKLESKKVKPVNSSQLIPLLNDKVKTRKDFLTTTEWQREKSLEFANLRLNVDKNRKCFKKTSQDFSIPKSKKSDDWFKFCFGAKPISSENTTSDDESINMPQDPTLTLLYTMDQSLIVQLFDFQVEWFEKYGFSDSAAKWIFSLMSFLEKPLLPETYSSLRTLARTCIKLRSNITNENDSSLISLNLFLAIVCRYFEQFDLLDEDF